MKNQIMLKIRAELEETVNSLHPWGNKEIRYTWSHVSIDEECTVILLNDKPEAIERLGEWYFKDSFNGNYSHHEEVEVEFTIEEELFILDNWKDLLWKFKEIHPNNKGLLSEKKHLKFMDRRREEIQQQITFYKEEKYEGDCIEIEAMKLLEKVYTDKIVESMRNLRV